MVSGMMRTSKSSLGDDLLSLFERACREEDFQVAEHLLEALETLERRDGAQGNLQSAFLAVARLIDQSR